MELAQMLVDEGVVGDKIVFFVQQFLYIGKEDKILPGQYVVNSSLSGEKIIEILLTPNNDEAEGQ